MLFLFSPKKGEKKILFFWVVDLIIHRNICSSSPFSSGTIEYTEMRFSMSYLTRNHKDDISADVTARVPKKERFGGRNPLSHQSLPKKGETGNYGCHVSLVQTRACGPIG